MSSFTELSDPIDGELVQACPKCAYHSPPIGRALDSL
jgi:hypothetical protein